MVDPRGSSDPALPRHSPRRWLVRAAPLLLAAASCAAVLLLLLAAEGALRLWTPGYLGETRGPHVFSSVYGWTPRKNTAVQVEGTLVTFNARGFRGRELALPRPGGRTRVVVLGDSVAFGLAVGDAETFTSLLDAGDNGIEAANLAVQGYGPDQELLVLLDEGLRNQPDVVVVAFCLANDFADSLLTTSLYDGHTPKPRFRLTDGGQLVLEDAHLRHSPPRRLQQWLVDHSQLFNRVLRAGGGMQPHEAVDWHERKRVALADQDYALRLNVALQRRIQAVCRERGIRLVVALFPNATTWRRKPSLAARFAEALEADGVQVLDMAQQLSATGVRFEDVTLDSVGHLNPRGHRLASEILAREIGGPREASR